ncbi:MAG: amino acid ABC transporter permease, partial [Oscillospiraceae bacterium]
GLGNTLLITLGAIAIGTVLGAILCLMKSSDHKLLSVPSRIYIDVIRGTPVMVQLLVMSLVVFTSRDANKLLVAILAFGMNSGAYVAEIFRSGIASVDAGQMEAGRSLGLSKGKTLQKIIFPQAIKNCLPTYASEFIVLVKETAVAGTIGIMDLTKVYSTIQSRTYDATAPLLIIVVMYFTVTKLLSILFAHMERRLRESDKR